MKVLMVLPSLDGGGIESVMFNYALYILPNIQVDFLVFSKSRGILEDLLIDKGLKVFHAPSLHESALNSILYQLKVMKSGSYDIVHVNSYNGVISLICAFAANVKIRICHAHTINPSSNLLGKALIHLVKKLDILLARGLFACSIDVSNWTWGNRRSNEGRTFIIPNAIEVERFVFSPISRRNLRDAMGISEDCFVVGNVARLSPEKNHQFLIHVFAEFHKMNPNSKLVIVGRGETEEIVMNLISNLGLSENVVLTGIRDDVDELLSAFDTFVLPSYYEGFPVTLIEAQANGLPIICSDKVSSEVNITQSIRFMSIDQAPMEWARILRSPQMKRHDPVTSSNTVSAAGFDVKSASAILVNSWSKLHEIWRIRD